LGSKGNKFITGNELKEMEKNWNRTWWCNNGKIESKEIILELCNWASTCLSNIIILAVWFGFVRLLRCKPQAEPNHAVQCKSHPNSSEPSAIFCGFGLNWFDLRFFYWVGSVLNTPRYTCSKFKIIIFFWCLRFELQTLHMICIHHTNWVKLTRTKKL